MFRARVNGKGNGKRSTGGSGSAPPDALARLFAIPTSSWRMCFDGDSTTQVAGQMWTTITDQLVRPGGEWAGATVLNNGSNGQTIEGRMSTDMNTIYSFNPNVTISCWLINDVRLGARDLSQCTANLNTYRGLLRTNVPLSDVVMWGPNAMQKNDPQGYGYVVPLASAQAYTDIMRNAYANMTLGANTASLQKQDATGSVCIDNSIYMQDILHPSNTGQSVNLAPLIQRLTPPVTPINLTASAAAWGSNPQNPWTVYSRALEDTRYCTLVASVLISNFVDISPPNYLYYLAPRWNNPAGIQIADIPTGGFFATPMGNYRFTGSETKFNLDSTSLQIQLPTAGGAPVTGNSVNAKIYKLV